MTLLCLPAPAWLSLSKTLAEVTAWAWPESSPEHLNHRAFRCDVKYDVLNGARGQGFDLVGCGNYTAVFSHDDAPGVVFKLNAGTRDCMEKYHRWLMGQTHENLPRVHHVEKYGEGCVAVAERLKPYGDIETVPYGEVSELLEGAGWPIDDLHSGNVMQRDDGTAIVNDPTSRPDCDGEETFYSYEPT